MPKVQKIAKSGHTAHFPIKKWLVHLGRGGGPSSNPDEVYKFSVNLFLKVTKTNKKEAVVGPLRRKSDVVLFNSIEKINVCMEINDDWIQSQVSWYRKQPRCQHATLNVLLPNITIGVKQNNNVTF